MAIKRHPLPRDILQCIGQYGIEWAEFESLFTLVLAIMQAADPARKLGPWEELQQQFKRRFRLWMKLAPLYVTSPRGLKKFNSLRGRIAKDYDNRQWLLHASLDRYLGAGHLIQTLHSAHTHADERQRRFNRDLLKRQLEHLQKTFDSFGDFLDAELWPQLEPWLGKSGGPTSANSIRRSLPKPEKL